MPDHDWIFECYEPKSCESDSWEVGLVPGRGGIEKFLGEESPVYVSIRDAGEDLLRARSIVRDLHERGATEDDAIPESLADDVCEAMSNFARTPSCRFYAAWLFLHEVVLGCIRKRAPKRYSDLPWDDAQYNAVVTYAFSSQLAAMKSPNARAKDDDNRTEETIRAMQACLAARPDDARMHVIFGNFLMINRFTQDAREMFEKALELDEEGCFGSHYSMANMIDNTIPDGYGVRKLNNIERMQALALKKLSQHHFTRYLELAPTGHWHVHRACIISMLGNSFVLARGSEKLQSIEKRHPGFCADAIALFERGVEALTLHTNCFGEEQSDFRNMYKQAASMASTIQRDFGLGNADAPPSAYICGNPACTNNWWSHTLKNCSSCFSISYCSKPCQVFHWKSGHKKDCKRMKAEYDERQKIVKGKRRRVKCVQIGDKP